jgi:hypothetical protein
MITPKEIKEKAEKKYYSYLQALVVNSPFEKIIIPGNKTYTNNSLSEFEKEIKTIISQSKEKQSFGYMLGFKKLKTKYLGEQDLPIEIYFDEEKDFLKFINKEEEVKLFKKNIEIIIAAFPQLKEWVIKNPKKVISKDKEWDSILKVCKYFTENPKPNLYIRELPINVHTKFIEQNKSVIKELLEILLLENVNSSEKLFEKRFNLKFNEPLIRFKILDKTISQQFFSGLDDISIPINQFENINLPIEKVLVVENKTSLYTTLTLPKMSNTIAIFGSGYSVNILKNVCWLNKVKLLYWGDIDVQGFEILSQFRSYFPNVESILMDKNTFDNFFENDEGTLTNISTTLNLTEEEQDLYNLLKINNWRLEQEKIPLEYVIRFI